jgi:hypothetical protein
VGEDVLVAIKESIDAVLNQQSYNEQKVRVALGQLRVEPPWRVARLTRSLCPPCAGEPVDIQDHRGVHEAPDHAEQALQVRGHLHDRAEERWVVSPPPPPAGTRAAAWQAGAHVDARAAPPPPHLLRAGAGLHAASSCFWDNAVDVSKTVKWENKTMYCICTVFGVAV